MYLTDKIKITKCLGGVAAGTSDQDGSSVDMTDDGGYDAVLFIFCYGALTATQVTFLKAEGSDDNSSWAAITGAACTALADDATLPQGLEVAKPTKRYIRPVVDRGTANAVIESVIAIQYRGRNVPADNDALVEIVRVSGV